MTDETKQPEAPTDEESTAAQAETASEPMAEPEPEPEPEPTMAAEATPDPVAEADPIAEPAAAEVEATPEPIVEPEPKPVAAEVEATPEPIVEPEPVTADAEPTPESVAESESQTEPVAVVAATEAEPEAEPAVPLTMAELLELPDNEVKSLKHGDVVEGTVVRIDPDEILVDFGGKSEGVVSNRELMSRRGPRDGDESRPELKVGDEVLVYVLQPESPEGHAVLSLRRAGLERKWRAMQERFDAGEIVEAKVIDHNKGGLIVDLGVRGFVPISQIVDFPRRPRDEQPRDAAQEIAEKLQPFVGRTLRLKILEVNRKANRLILSEKVALYEERREKRDELFSSLQVGQRVTGVVRSIAPFGVFIDLGGIDGLVHKSELSWNKVNNPETAYAIGEEVEAEVIDINHERGRISLSIRRLQPDPWQESVAKYQIGDLISGTVTKLVNFGAFVRVEEGLEGLIHISELSNQRVAHPGDVVKEGEVLKLKIISLDSERHRLGLSLKQAEERSAVATPTAAAPARFEDRPAPRRDRRDRRDRDYRPEDAVSEPDEGIDNTMAAAFAESGLLAQFRTSESKSQAAEAPQTEAPQTEAPQAEAPQAEAPAAAAVEVASEGESADAAPEAAAETVEAEARAPEAGAAAGEPSAEPTPEAVAADATEAAAEPEAEPEPEPEAVAVAESESEAVPVAEVEAEPAPAPVTKKSSGKSAAQAKA
ncbi:MAG TPA: 30S ribosomal protein S1 [Candidatus Dormibacteraeota bacterium]|nr:30S ribosomal protein S1 [Candidatus Dormibacteraeota bacterium]